MHCREEKHHTRGPGVKFKTFPGDICIVFFPKGESPLLVSGHRAGEGPDRTVHVSHTYRLFAPFQAANV